MSDEQQEVTSHRHFSSRLGREFQDGDLLYLDEVAKVLTENSDGRQITVKYVTELVVKGMLPAEGKPRQRLVKYSDVRYRRVLNQPGKRKHDNPTPNALRQREFRKRRAAADQELQKVG